MAQESAMVQRSELIQNGKRNKMAQGTETVQRNKKAEASEMAQSK